MYRIFWLDDKTDYELKYIVAPVLLDGQYVLESVRDASEAVEMLKAQVKPYDAYIFDLRIPPGNEKVLVDLDKQEGNIKLGYELLRFWLQGDIDIPDEKKDALRLKFRLDANRIGIFSIYAEDMKSKLMHLGIKEKAIIQKTAGMQRTTLKDFIQSVIRMSKG